jgi:endoglucanase
VAWALDQATRNQLAVVINIHHYDEIFRDPEGHRERLMALWKQIAERFREAPESVAFELLNEPHDKLNAKTWNRFAAEALAIVRASNPKRVVIVGPANWNGFRGIDALELPTNDRRIIVTFHYYEPMPVTHQGASWVKGSDRWLGTKWTASDAEMKAIREAFDTVKGWADREGRPIYLGEFGAYSRADMSTRALWTKMVRQEAEARGFSFAYWEFASGFGAYDLPRRQWRQPLLSALIAGSDKTSPPP